jgi:hypothetical protein
VFLNGELSPASLAVARVIAAGVDLVVRQGPGFSSHQPALRLHLGGCCCAAVTLMNSLPSCGTPVTQNLAEGWLRLAGLFQDGEAKSSSSCGVSRQCDEELSGFVLAACAQ